MPIDNPSLLLRHTSPSCVEDEALKVSASGGVVLTTTPAMDVVSVQRPDKVSPCPRCQSLDTKFCYFNNHNVKQPRHFCRKCQRYWTAGGALRNVPVGAGRRKHKTPLNSTSPKLHPEANDLVSASGMCYPSSKTVHFLTPPHMDGTQRHSFQCVGAMSTHEEDSHSGFNACESIREAMVHKPATEFSFLCDAQSDTGQKEGALSSLRHHAGAFYGVQKGTGQVQHRDETLFTEALPRSHNEKVEDEAPLPSSSLLPSHRSIEVEKMGVESSASTCPALDKRMGVAHPLLWLEHLAKANAAVTSESLQGGYGYGNASLAWSHALMWPWLIPYASNNGPTCSNMNQAAVSAAWASAVSATAANILQAWNPYGWGRDVNKSEGLSLLGKRGYSSLHEQEPLRVPKTLKIGDPEEAMHSSILMTLGLSSLSASSPASVAGFFNTTLQPKPDVPQHKPVELSQQHREQQWSHVNPAAQARSHAFQESS